MALGDDGVAAVGDIWRAGSACSPERSTWHSHVANRASITLRDPKCYHPERLALDPAWADRLWTITGQETPEALRACRWWPRFLTPGFCAIGAQVFDGKERGARDSVAC